MKTESSALRIYRAQGSTTLAWCWKVTRRDGFVAGVTTCARDLLFEGVLYEAREGFTPKAISQEATAAVVNSEVEGLLSDEFEELDFESGLWDGCIVELFEVNYRDLAMGKMRMGLFTLGDIKVSRGSFNVEIRGLTQSLQKQSGRVVTKGCPWRFGDPTTCRKDLGPLTVAGVITGADDDLRGFTDSTRVEAENYFAGGVVSWSTGANIGLSMEIYSSIAGVFVLHLPMSRPIQIGDAYTMTPGCLKDYDTDCRARWNNTNNFGGFPLLPGPDKVLGLGGTEGTNL